MNHDWDAKQLLTEHFDVPIRFYLHERRVDLENIKIHVDDRIHGIDSDGTRHSLHKDDILFAFPVDKMSYVRPHITMSNRVKSLRLNRRSNAQNRFCIDDGKLAAAIQKNIVLVTRRGHVIRGELQAFDKLHLFMRIGSKVVLVYRQGLFAFRTKVNDLRELHKKREKWVEANRENNFEDGIKQLLTDLYPDNAHFIYELLQNAEDAEASEVRFVLKEDSAIFEHNGSRIFSLKDVDAITSIGFSTKRDDHTSIGKFGIGFKAVFAYTTTPEVESGEFHFRIRDMVVPDTQGLVPGELGWEKTRFVFPFDNPKKPPEKAREEIEMNLRELNENTLLFLSNIRKVEYLLPDSTMGSMERKESANNKNRIEISITRPRNPVPDSIHYRRFTKEVEVQDEDGQFKRCRIAVAFGTDKSRKITSLNQGQVCIYFPAVKETSKLRFHLHAPFASTVARDSVRDCSANDQLRDHLAELIAGSMHTIRDQGLLDVEFLATLPNNRDDLRPFYLPIQEQLIEEFNTEKLTPVKRRRSEHVAASGTYRGSNVLSDLINDGDLATLFGKDHAQPLWIANPQQRNQREDNFLSMLDITEWEIEDFIEVLKTRFDTVKEWIKEKPNEWHQDLYVLLGDFLLRSPSSRPYIERERREKLSNLRIVRCNDGEYRTGRECHFLDDVEFEVEKEKTQSEEFHYVAKGVCSSGQNKNRQQKAREFLEKIGACELNETERIKAILRQRYEDPYTEISPKLHEEDMQRFIALVEQDPDKAVLLKDYRVFRTADRGSFDEGFYHKACMIFLDSPYLETGLKGCYEDNEYWELCMHRNSDPYLSLDYEESDIDLKKLGKFAEKLGAKTKLTVDPQSALGDHPESNDFADSSDESGNFNFTNTGIDKDYRIHEFQILLNDPTIAKSELIWQSMLSVPSHYLKAQFRWNQRQKTIIKGSSLVYDLKDRKWVPQKNGDSISFVYPRDASIERLPKGFPYETGQNWLDAIEFGKTAKQQTAEDTLKRIEQNRRNQRAKEWGFESGDAAEKAAEFFKEQGKSPDELLKKLRVQKRRKELLIIELEDAEEKEFETRARSIRSSRSRIEPKIALRAQYTTDENSMPCQMCSKTMPFKKRNSDEDYFDAVEALGKGYFFKEHEAQYLALCPECAAEYQEYVKRDPKAREIFYDALKNSDSPQIHVESNGRTIRIWFEDKHWQDLKTVLYYYENIYDPDDAD